MDCQARAELIARLLEADPSGTWLNSEQSEGNDDIESARQADASDAQPTTSRQQREADLCRREKELAERELAIVRLELETTRKMQTERAAEDNRLRQPTCNGEASIEGEQVRPTTANRGHDFIGPIRTNITAVVDLLGVFNGKSNYFERGRNKSN